MLGDASCPALTPAASVPTPAPASALPMISHVVRSEFVSTQELNTHIVRSGSVTAALMK